MIINDRKKRKEEKKKINGKFSTNRVFAYRENIFVPANFLHTAGIKISYYRNARVYTYIYIYGKLKQHGVFTMK